ncbi:MAG: MBL fold metallo-hydrolase [Phycisphaerales bacterium]|nr:MBL fold metallo-hydrolase [Phycisphaerales bacterium]
MSRAYLADAIPAATATLREMSATPSLSIKSFALGDFVTNAYVVFDPSDNAKSCWIIDCPYEPSAMIEAILRAGLKPELCILTHCHCDHIAGLAEMRLKLGPVPILCHVLEKDFNADPNLNLSAFIPPGLSAPEPEGYLAHGQVILLPGLGEYAFQVVHAPGHSPGMICLWCAQAELAFVGDTLFEDSIGRTDFPTSDPQAMDRSLRLLLTLPDATKIYPGHGSATTIGRERRSNPFLRALT